jgi:hypothetical protein
VIQRYLKLKINKEIIFSSVIYAITGYPVRRLNIRKYAIWKLTGLSFIENFVRHPVSNALWRISFSSYLP